MILFAIVLLAQVAAQPTPSPGPPLIKPVAVDGGLAFVDASGRLVSGAKFLVCEARAEEAAALLVDGQRAHIDLTGRLVLGFAKPPPKLETVVAISKVVKEAGSQEQRQKWGFADSSGRVVVEPQFDEFQGFSEGIGRVVANGRYGFVDAAGTLLVAPRYKGAYWFAEGLSCVTLDDDKRAYVDPLGRILSDPRYEYMDAWFSEGLTPARWRGKWGYVDKTWKFVVPPRFDAVPQAFSDGLAAVRINGMTAVINRVGEEVIPPREWIVGTFSEGLAPFRLSKSDSWGYIDGKVQSNRWGYIDRQGREVIAPRFVVAGSFHGGLAQVTESTEIFSIEGGCYSGYGVINRLGKYLWRGRSLIPWPWDLAPVR